MWAGTALGYVDAIWECKGDSVVSSAPGMEGEQQILVLPQVLVLAACPAAHLHSCPSKVSPKYWLFSLGSFHSSTPFNFFYRGLSFGIFRIYDKFMYNLPCSVV